MKDEIVGSGWIELVAVDGGCQRSQRGRYFKQSRWQVVIDLRSTLNSFQHSHSARVHITSSDFYHGCSNAESDG